MIHGALNILILSVLLLVVGLWKPKWILFWMDKPSRFAIIMIFSVMIMIGGTMFGEGSRQKQLEDDKISAQKLKSEQSALPKTNQPPVDLPKITDLTKPKISTADKKSSQPNDAAKPALADKNTLKEKLTE